MEPMTLAVAGVAALAILLIAVGVASSGRSGISDRLERYASGKAEAQGRRGDRPGPDQRPDRPERRRCANLNKVVERRDFGANLARDIARADLKLKPSEFLMIWAGSIVGIPVADDHLRLRSSRRSGRPLVLLVGALDRLLPAALLARPPQERPARTPSTSSCPTRSR